MGFRPPDEELGVSIYLIAYAAPEDVPVHGCFCFLNPEDQAGGSESPLTRTEALVGLFPRHDHE